MCISYKQQFCETLIRWQPTAMVMVVFMLIIVTIMRFVLCVFLSKKFCLRNLCCTHEGHWCSFLLHCKHRHVLNGWPKMCDFVDVNKFRYVFFQIFSSLGLSTSNNFGATFYMVAMMIKVFFYIKVSFVYSRCRICHKCIWKKFHICTIWAMPLTIHLGHKNFIKMFRCCFCAINDDAKP